MQNAIGRRAHSPSIHYGRTGHWTITIILLLVPCCWGAHGTITISCCWRPAVGEQHNLHGTITTILYLCNAREGVVRSSETTFTLPLLCSSCMPALHWIFCHALTLPCQCGCRMPFPIMRAHARRAIYIIFAIFVSAIGWRGAAPHPPPREWPIWGLCINPKS